MLEKLKILIVDDEVVFRSYLKKILDWKRYGYCICGEAGDGLEAKIQLEQQHPDIVITDIRMPDVDGLALMSYIHEQYSDIPIIALSGYEDFSYARDCIKFGVVDYLLKHSVTKESLLLVLDSVKKHLMEKKDEQISQMRIKEQLSYGQNVLRQKFLLDILEGKIKNAQVISQKIEQLALPLDMENVVLVVAEIDGISSLRDKYSAQDWELRLDEITEIIEKVLVSMGRNFVVRQSDSRFTMLITMKNMRSVMRFYNHVGDCITQVRNVLKRHCNITACYSISGFLENISEASVAYQKAAEVFITKLYQNYDTVIRYQSIPKTAETVYSFSMEDEQTLLLLLKGGHSEKIKLYLARIFDQIKESHLEAARVQIIFAGLFNVVNRYLHQYNLDITVICPDFQQMMLERYQHMNLAEMRDWTTSQYLKALQYTSTSENEEFHEVTKKALAYIKKDFVNILSLNDIAEQIKVSPSYLSRIFKEDVGKGVVEYLNSIRVEYAKQLIKEGVKFGELPKRVGFNSNTYFFTVFKQNTGQTPKQYKQNQKYSDDVVKAD